MNSGGRGNRGERKWRTSFPKILFSHEYSQKIFEHKFSWSGCKYFINEAKIIFCIIKVNHLWCVYTSDQKVYQKLLWGVCYIIKSRHMRQYAQTNLHKTFIKLGWCFFFLSLQKIYSSNLFVARIVVLRVLTRENLLNCWLKHNP